MIKNFRSRALKRFWFEADSRGLPWTSCSIEQGSDLRCTVRTPHVEHRMRRAINSSGVFMSMPYCSADAPLKPYPDALALDCFEVDL